MTCVSLRHDGDELLGRVDLPEGPTHGIPLLHPWANRLALDRFPVGDRMARIPPDRTLVARDGRGLPLHGVRPRRGAWTVLDQQDGSLSSRLTFDETAPAFAAFPFSHTLELMATVRADGLDIEVTLSATDGVAVPVAFGFHPYLRLPGVPREQWELELPAMRRQDVDRRGLPLGTSSRVPQRRVLLGDGHFDDGFIEVAPDARFGLVGPRRRIDLSLRGGFDAAQLYAPRGAQVVSVEPLTAPTNALLTGSGLRWVGRGGTFTAAFALRTAVA